MWKKNLNIQWILSNSLLKRKNGEKQRIGLNIIEMFVVNILNTLNKIQEIFEKGTIRRWPYCGLGGRKDSACNLIKCQGCKKRYWYFWGKKDEEWDRWPPGKSFYNHFDTKIHKINYFINNLFFYFKTLINLDHNSILIHITIIY